MVKKVDIKRVLGELPLTAEVYWQLRQSGKPLSKSFSMRRTQDRLPDWVLQASLARGSHRDIVGKRVIIFATLRYWIEHAVLMGVGMAGMGHDVTLAYLPYANWHTATNRFDLRRNNAYAKHILGAAEPLLRCISFLDVQQVSDTLPDSISVAIQEISIRDVQYTQQIEDVDQEGDLYRLRLQRNTAAAHSALHWMSANRPDVLLTPNGSIMEMGAVYTVARHLDIPVVTYEFGKQRDRIWLARDAEVMRQDTDDLWWARQDDPLTEAQWKQIRALFSSRQNASLWENFSRRWQGTPSQGGKKVRQELGLDSRPVVLLAANVIGDSLTLGRQVFTDNMTEWLERTVSEFALRSDAQLVVRIHPGERYTKGPSVADVLRGVKEFPKHIHLVAADDPVNTYDLVDIADLGLVYTTTVGLEMAMSGVPVLVIGQTHYRGKDFTLDPGSWEEYTRLLDSALADPAGHRLSRERVVCAWNYAYKFFFEYPCPFPWHLLHFWDELEAWPVSQVLSREGRAQFGDTFRYLLGKPREWTDQVDTDPVVNTSKVEAVSQLDI